METGSPSSPLPPITKRELARVGIQLHPGENVRTWLHRGRREMEAHLFLATHAAQRRRFEEDGA